MARGLAHLIEKVTRDPSNKVLVHRLLVLLAEMQDNAEKLHLTMELAKAVFKTMPFDALRLAHVVFGKASEKLEFAQLGYDVGSLKLMVDALKELGRFAKATIVEVELEKLIESKKHLGQTDRQFKKNDVNKMMREFSDEISRVTGQREDSLGNILTQLAKGHLKNEGHKYKLPDLDLFGKDDLLPPEQDGNLVFTEHIIAEQQQDESHQNFRISGLMENENQLQMPGRKPQSSVNGEQVRFPEKKVSHSATAHFASLDFSKNNPIVGTTDGYDEAVDVALDLMQDSNQNIENHGHSDYFSLHLEQHEDPVLIKRTPIFREDSNQHTQMSVMPHVDEGYAWTAPVSEPLNNDFSQGLSQPVEPEGVLEENLPRHDYGFVSHEEQQGGGERMPASSHGSEAGVQVNVFNQGHIESASTARKPRKAKLKTHKNTAKTHDQEMLLHRIQKLVQENRKAAQSPPEHIAIQHIPRSERWLQQEVELSRFFFAWLQRLAPHFGHKLSDGAEISSETLQYWEKVWEQAGGAKHRDRHLQWLRSWQRYMQNDTHLGLGESGLSVLVSMLLSLGVKAWWQVAQTTMGRSQSTALTRALLACLIQREQWRRLLVFAQEFLLLVDDLASANVWYEAYVLACTKLHRVPLQWQQELGLASLRQSIVQRPNPKVSLLLCAV